ncbi:MAG: hypothetical protein ACJ74O_18930 [Frankiaceae bacterium]
MAVVIALAVAAGVLLIAVLYVRSVRRDKALGHRARSVHDVQRREIAGVALLEADGEPFRDPRDSGFSD